MDAPSDPPLALGPMCPGCGSMATTRITLPRDFAHETFFCTDCQQTWTVRPGAHAAARPGNTDTH